MKHRSVLAAAFVLSFAVLATIAPRAIGARVHGAPVAQEASVAQTVDFQRDVQPLLRQHCIGCHGPSQQMNGFRLDRRRDAMRGGTAAVIGPGNSEASRLYLRLIGSQYGPQMPPTGPLSATQIQVIKAWIDQGAQWPDELSGEGPPAIPDADATRLIDLLRQGAGATFRSALAQHPHSAGRHGPAGTTPLMAAALYGDADSVRSLLDAGADPAARNEAGATALMWAVTAGHEENVRLLLARGADVNARSEDRRTALLIASGRFGSGAIVGRLLAAGADPSASASGLFGDTNPLTEAAFSGDAAVFRMLVDRGADLKAALPFGVSLARRSGCTSCESTLLAAMPPPLVDVAAALEGPPLGDARGIAQLLEHGANPNAQDLEGRTLLMLAASSDAMPVETVRALLQKGADVHARSPRGESALALARLRGDTEVVRLLRKAGARDDRPAPARPAPTPAGSARAAVARSLPLLDRSDETFLRKSGCVSCHNNSLASMTRWTARRHGLAVNDDLAARQVTAIAAYLESWRDRVLQHNGIPGDADTISYLLLGLAVENHPPDTATDAMAYFLRNKQAPDGRWAILAHRPPIESSDIQVTAASMRALQLYAPPAKRAEFQRSVDRAASWLAAAQPRVTEERVFHLLGLLWSDGDRAIRQAAASGLVAEQRADGGWAQLPSLASDAYATGQALVALLDSGAVTAADPLYRRGVQFLLRTQLADGSWYVPTRAIPIQPLFDAGFPHGRDAFISAAATGWATMALIPAVDR